MAGSVCAPKKRAILSAAARKLFLELLNAARGVNKALFASVCRMGVCCYVANYNEMVYTVDFFNLLALHFRTRYEARAGRYVYKANRVEVWMDFVFHF